MTKRKGFLPFLSFSLTGAFVAPRSSSWGHKVLPPLGAADPITISTSEEIQAEFSAFVEPPTPLKDLPVGDCFRPFDDSLTITRLAEDVPIFLVQNFLTESDIFELVEQTLEGEFETAETKQNATTHRIGSRVQWIPCDATQTTKFMADLSAALFLPPQAPIEAESLQVVHYNASGKFDLHHDGFNRTVTVLTYLNGVAGTWFPYVGAASDEEVPEMKLENQGMLQGLEPGQDGLLIAGVDDFSHLPASNKVVRIQPGNAIVFYNYENHEQYGRIMNWKTVHCGLPATETKWIATNWFQLKEE